MVCMHCGTKTRVVNSRAQKRSNSVWRRRHCTACGSIFSTAEHIDYEKSIVVQSVSGALSPFLRDKLFASIYRSCQHRPTAITDTIGLTDTVINKIWKLTQDGKLNARIIASLTHDTLKHFDPASGVSYAAFHNDTLGDTLS